MKIQFSSLSSLAQKQQQQLYNLEYTYVNQTKVMFILRKFLGAYFLLQLRSVCTLKIEIPLL